MSHIVKARWIGESKFKASTPGGELMMSPPDEGGFGPKALMLDALVGCTGLDVAFIIKKMRLEVEGFDLEIEGHLTEEHPVSYHTVDLKYIFKGTNLNEEKLQRAIDLSSEKYCGVMDMFRKFAKINMEVEYIHN